MGFDGFDNDYDYDPCELWVQREQTARKPYKCYCSGLYIWPGVRYIQIFGKFDGDVFYFKIHPVVWELINKYRMDIYSFKEQLEMEPEVEHEFRNRMREFGEGA